MKKTSRSHHGTMNELNITPLLDLAFVLLVIFIITTPQLVNNLEMSLPSAEVPPLPPDAPKPEIDRIRIDARGQTYLNEEPMAVSQLRERLERRKASNPDPSVVVDGSDEADYQSVIRVLDTLRELEITKVGLATRQEAAP